MKPSNFVPQDQTYWYLNQAFCKPLTKDITTDVVIVGGGMAGLSAAQAFRDKGLSVVLLEKNFCGSGASGKSSGFITPNSELSLYQLIDTYGKDNAKKLWEFAGSGVEHIRANIQTHNLVCDFQEQDTLVVASSSGDYTKEILKEHHARKQVGYESHTYTKEQASAIIGSDSYFGALSYGNSFSIRSYAYCQEMKRVLLEQGVHIYEETPVIDIQQNLVKTLHHIVKAQHIIVCMDHYAQHISALKDRVYHVQTFLGLSAPLSHEQRKDLFPQKDFMAWDTDLIYHYFRFTPDNRLLIGGANLWDTYSSEETHNNKHMAKALTRYINSKFPELNLSLEYIWPGLIGVSKDLFPIAGFDQDKPSVYYITAATGLPWAAALGRYSAQQIIEKDISFETYFSPYRSFKLGSWTTKLVGHKLSFALSHYLTSSSF